MASPILDEGVGSPQSIHQVSTIKHHKIGTRGRLGDGRVFYYSSLAISGTALVRANLLIARAAISTVTTQATSGGTLTAGATTVSIDTSGAVTAGQLDEGMVSIPDALGEGFEYKIRSHTTVGGAGVITVNLYDPIVIAGSTASNVTLFANMYSNPQATTTLGVPAGVTKVAVAQSTTAEQYFWVQTWGESSVLAPAAVSAVGSNLIQSTTTAGSMAVGAAHTDLVLGSARVTQISGDFQLVYLMIRA